MNRKRVQRQMREDNLLCVRKRKFVVTTDSAHGLKVYPNLAGSMILTGVDQLWVADITYCRTFAGWVYAAALGFALVYLGEHYVVDLLAGLALVIAVRRGEPVVEPVAQAVSRFLQRFEGLANG